MKVSRLLEILLEFDRLGFGGHPDDSGIRGKGANRKPDRRLQNFPYDRDIFYGQPTAYDRGSSATGPLSKPLTPKDDLHYSLKLLGIELPDEVEEAMGTPTNFGISGKSNMGSTVPGVGSGWATNPPRSWDKSDIDDEMDEGPLNIDTSPPETEEIPSMQAPDFRFQTDDDLETRLNRIWGKDSNMNFVNPKDFANPDFHLINKDPLGQIMAHLTNRGTFGLMPKESAWDRVTGQSRNKR